MVEVEATQRGYYGGAIRDPGDRFMIDDEIMKDEKRRPSWVKLVAFGGKGDHDGDGKTGGAKPAAEKPAKGKKAAPVEMEVFGDAPEPVRVENEVNKALGSTEPDWVAPKPID